MGTIAYTDDRDTDFRELELAVKASIESTKEPMFHVNTSDIFESFLLSIPEVIRQYYNCNCCRSFVNKYGNLVTINKDGSHRSVVWSEDLPGNTFNKAVRKVRRKVEKASVSRAFVSSDRILGTPEAGGWTHLYSINPRVHTSTIKSAGQTSAEITENYRMTRRAMSKYSDITLRIAREFLKTAYRGDKLLPQLEWLKSLNNNDSLVWRAVVDAPAGFPNVNSGALGALLDNIQKGMSRESIVNQFNSMMDGTNYMRVKSDAKMGTIVQAEKLFNDMGLNETMNRRFAALSDLVLFWRPKKNTPTYRDNTLFSGLKLESYKNSRLKGETITLSWKRFERTALKGIDKLEYVMPKGRQHYRTFTTGPEGKVPLFKWDNPVASYVWTGGTHPESMGLCAGRVEIEGIFSAPWMWTDPDMKGEREAVNFAIKGAVEKSGVTLALFPENLNSDLHSVRKVIENHSLRNVMEDVGSKVVRAVSIDDSISGGINHKFIATTDNIETTYIIDRWD